jgi:hypothetical protein
VTDGLVVQGVSLQVTPGLYRIPEVWEQIVQNARAQCLQVCNEKGLVPTGQEWLRVLFFRWEPFPEGAPPEDIPPPVQCMSQDATSVQLLLEMACVPSGEPGQ